MTLIKEPADPRPRCGVPRWLHGAAGWAWVACVIAAFVIVAWAQIAIPASAEYDCFAIPDKISITLRYDGSQVTELRYRAEANVLGIDFTGVGKTEQGAIDELQKAIEGKFCVKHIIIPGRKQRI